MTAALDKGAGVILFPEYFGNLLMGIAGEPIDLDDPSTLELLSMILQFCTPPMLTFFRRSQPKLMLRLWLVR